jgi:hypothetical protein
MVCEVCVDNRRFVCYLVEPGVDVVDRGESCDGGVEAVDFRKFGRLVGVRRSRVRKISTYGVTVLLCFLRV